MKNASTVRYANRNVRTRRSQKAQLSTKSIRTGALIVWELLIHPAVPGHARWMLANQIQNTQKPRNSSCKNGVAYIQARNRLPARINQMIQLLYTTR
jgi:hypothetical protein